MLEAFTFSSLYQAEKFTGFENYVNTMLTILILQIETQRGLVIEFEKIGELKR